MIQIVRSTRRSGTSHRDLARAIYRDTWEARVFSLCSSLPSIGLPSCEMGAGWRPRFAPISHSVQMLGLGIGATMRPVLFILAGLPAIALAQDFPDAPQPKTPSRFELFSAKTGVINVRSFSDLGTISGLGRVSIDVRSQRDAAAKTGQFGIGVTVHESDRLARSDTAFVDDEEIDPLLRAIDYIARFDGGVVPFDRFEAQYRTRGGLQVTVFSSPPAPHRLVVSTGVTSSRVSAFFPISDVNEFRRLIEEGQKRILAAKRQKQ